MHFDHGSSLDADRVSSLFLLILLSFSQHHPRHIKPFYSPRQNQPTNTTTDRKQDSAWAVFICPAPIKVHMETILCMAPSAGVIPHTVLTSTPAVLWDEGSCGGALGPLVSGVAMALVLRNVTAQASGLNLFPTATQMRMESFPAMKGSANFIAAQCARRSLFSYISHPILLIRTYGMAAVRSLCRTKQQWLI